VVDEGVTPKAGGAENSERKTESCTREGNGGRLPKKNHGTARKYLGPRREDVLATTGLSAGRHAAVIQQRLEFLLFKEKERKSLVGERELLASETKIKNDGFVVRKVDCGWY
jgi:hypothetical protein